MDLCKGKAEGRGILLGARLCSGGWNAAPPPALASASLLVALPRASPPQAAEASFLAKQTKPNPLRTHYHKHSAARVAFLLSGLGGTRLDAQIQAKALWRTF